MDRLLTATLVMLGGCMLGPDFEVPEVEVPDSYREATVDGESAANLPWWEVFQDAALQEHIETALRENQDLEIALMRIAEARAALGFTAADQYPSFRYGADAFRADPGDLAGFGQATTLNQFRIGAVDMFWELDLWGKLRRSTEAAHAELLATEAAYVNVAITLVADVALLYLQLLDLDAQLEITRRTLSTRQDATRIIRDRFREGVVAQLDVHQAEIEEATTEVGIAQVERQIKQTEHALRVLLGGPPGPIERGDGLADEVPPAIPVGLPSELLQRRPDVKVAEAVAHAQTARIGVAEALKFPSLSLTGLFGFGSVEVEDLLSSRARLWSVGAALTGPLFEFNKNTRRVEVEEARARQAITDYERVVLQAFREVEDALVEVRTFREEFEARTRQVEAARGSARLSRALYDEQFTSYLDVLDAERSLFNAELERSRTLRQSLQAVVTLYRALGGGWARGDTAEALAEAAEETQQ